MDKQKKQARLPRIVVAAREHERLMQMAELALEGGSPIGEYLVQELSRAFLVRDEDLSPYVVRMGSRVTFVDDVSGRRHDVVLVYPESADVDEGRVSILSPIGAALIGLSPAQSIRWQDAHGRAGALTVLDVKDPRA